MQTATARLLVIGTSLLAISVAWAQDQTRKGHVAATAQKGGDPAAVEALLPRSSNISAGSTCCSTMPG